MRSTEAGDGSSDSSRRTAARTRHSSSCSLVLTWLGTTTAPVWTLDQLLKHCPAASGAAAAAYPALPSIAAAASSSSSSLSCLASDASFAGASLAQTGCRSLRPLLRLRC